MRRVLLFGLAWTAVLAVVGALLHSSSRLRSDPSPAATAASQITRVVGQRASETRYPGWTVRKAFSAHHVMVVEVETDRPENARQIAVQIVEPLRSRYEEVLVYVRRPGSTESLAARRVQWTPNGGYVEIDYETVGKPNER